ncbi:MAG: MCE family protein [Bacteroidetes bacterium]|nr:MCE family protein [Bacteroidota bacterium]
MNIKLKREVKIGILVVASIAFLFWGINFLKGKNFLTGGRTFYAIFNQVNGLTEANIVVVNGLKVGLVTDISFIDTKGRILVEMKIDEDVKIANNSIAKIFNPDVIGSRVIEIKLGNNKTLAMDGDTLKSEEQLSILDEVSIQMLPFKVKAEKMMASIDTVISVIQYVFNESTRDNLMHSFESIKNTITNLESTTYNIDTLVSTQRFRLSQIISNVENITSVFKNNNAKLNNIITNFSSISDSLARIKFASTINKADKILASFSEITEKINKGDGSLGLLINNDSLYIGLQKSSKEMNLLLEDLRLNPQRYVHLSVFGKNLDKNKYKAPAEKK